jgi:cell division protease FtsH
VDFNKNKQDQPDNNNPRRGQKSPDGGSDFKWQKSARTMLFWAVIFMAGLLFYQFLSGGSQDILDINYSELIDQINAGNVAKVVFVEKDIKGDFVNEVKKTVNNRPVASKKFKTRVPFEDPKLIDLLQTNKIVVVAEDNPRWMGLLWTALPWLILVFWMVFMLKQMQGGGPKGLFSFGKSRARLLSGSRPKVSFMDVAGCDEAKQELQEIIEFLREPAKFQKLGGKIPRGALLLGPPGSGKTLLAKAVAGEAGVPFFSMSGSDFVEMFVGVGASRVRDLFDQGKRNAPCIIFIDEIDAVGRHRGAGLGGGHDEREQTLNQLLVEMDGFESNDGVIMLAATNRPDVLDPALLRPGRFDRQIVVANPDVKGREGILKVHARKINIDDKVDLKILARATPGLSGADLANLVNEAALLAARKNHERVFMTDFEEAKDKVMMGTERRSLMISPEEKKITAYHEAGHAILGKLIPGSDPVYKVTIIPRGIALGLTSYLPVDDRHNLSKNYIETKLTQIMGGRVAETLVFNELTTGAGNDLEHATNLARKMVCNWGMSERLGPLTFGKKEEHIFLGKELASARDYSEQTALEIDAEVKKIVLNAQERAKQLLSNNIEKLHRVAIVLLEKETLDGEEIDQIFGEFDAEKEVTEQKN